MRVLILGGTRFVGKRLVYLLAEQGHHVTVGSRGRASASFPDNIQRVTLDRTRIDSMKKGLEGGEWDLVYDQLCFSADDAATALDVFSGKTGRYVLCSSAAVYTNPVDAAEEEFDPNIFTVSKGNGAGPSYAEGKRQAEAVLFQRASFPVVAARFPIILGPDDYTKRLRVQIQRIANNDPVHIKNPEAEISLISSSRGIPGLSLHRSRYWSVQRVFRWSHCFKNYCWFHRGSNGAYRCNPSPG